MVWINTETAKRIRRRFVSAHGVPRIRTQGQVLRGLKAKAQRVAPKIKRRVPKLAPFPKVK